MKGAYRGIARIPAAPGIIQPSEPRKANSSAVTQVNAVRPRYEVGAANMPTMAKPVEATSGCSDRAPWGERGRRAETDDSGTRETRMRVAFPWRRRAKATAYRTPNAAGDEPPDRSPLFRQSIPHLARDDEPR